MGLLDSPSYLSDAEKELKKRFSGEGFEERRVPSDAADARQSERVDQLVLADELRGKMPLTKDKYLVRENPHLVAWEREVRKFLRNLSPEHGHRVSAIMIYEWATGMSITELSKLTKEKAPERGQTWRSDLRKLNRVLEWYFGKPYMTYICGKKVPRTYRVRPGYYIRRHRPMTLTLWFEYTEGVLYP
jgi:hypothetical protein